MKVFLDPFLLILLCCYPHITIGQNNTLTFEQLNFSIVGEIDKVLDDINPLDVKVVISYLDTIKNPKIYSFGYTHMRQKRFMENKKYLFQPKSNPDTLQIEIDRLIPKDMIYIEYYENTNRQIEYLVNSTTFSNNKPYYIDYIFVHNGDTVNTNQFSIIGKQVYTVENTIYRDEIFLRAYDINVRVFHQSKSINFTISRSKGYLPIYHGAVVLGYFDNLEDLNGKLDSESYQDIMDYAQRFNHSKIITIEQINYDTNNLRRYSIKGAY